MAEWVGVVLRAPGAWYQPNPWVVLLPSVLALELEGLPEVEVLPRSVLRVLPRARFQWESLGFLEPFIYYKIIIPPPDKNTT